MRKSRMQGDNLLLGPRGRMLVNIVRSAFDNAGEGTPNTGAGGSLKTSHKGVLVNSFGHKFIAARVEHKQLVGSALGGNLAKCLGKVVGPSSQMRSNHRHPGRLRGPSNGNWR